MADDLIPSVDPKGFLDKLNLPKLVAGPAGDAISRLVGGVVDIPAAWMHQVAQGIRDKTEAKSTVSKAVAEAAAKLVKDDSEIVQRAAHALLAKQLRRQSNREEIAKKTIEILGAEQTDSTQQASSSKVDDDWLNVFERYAEDASSERLQELWARVLAGQIRRAGAFSLATLRFVAELDNEIAQLFEKYAPAVINGSLIPFADLTPGPSFSEILQLEEYGLLVGVHGIQTTFNLKPGKIGFKYKNHIIVVSLDGETQFVIPGLSLTRVGREIYSILPLVDDIKNAQRFVEKCSKEHLTSIEYVSTKIGEQAPTTVNLWARPLPKEGASSA